MNRPMNVDYMQVRTVDTHLGPRLFTDATFFWRGQAYGSRYHGALTPGQFEAEKRLFIQRRQKEEGR